MEFTTLFAHQSQGVRLFEKRPYELVKKLRDYHPLWSTVPGEFAPPLILGLPPQNYNSTKPKPGRFRFELIPLHSQLLGESSLVSFPPDNDMLKSSGWSKSEAKRS